MEALARHGILVEIIDWDSIFQVFLGVLSVDTLTEPLREIVAEVIRNYPLL